MRLHLIFIIRRANSSSNCPNFWWVTLSIYVTVAYSWSLRFPDQTHHKKTTPPASMSPFSHTNRGRLSRFAVYYQLHWIKGNQSLWLCVFFPICTSLASYPRNIWLIQGSCWSWVQVVAIPSHLPHSRQDTQQTYRHGLDRSSRAVSTGSPYGLGRPTEAQCKATHISLETILMDSNTNFRWEKGIYPEHSLWSFSMG